jgi:hypothetical protein
MMAIFLIDCIGSSSTQFSSRKSTDCNSISKAQALFNTSLKTFVSRIF